MNPDIFLKNPLKFKFVCIYPIIKSNNKINALCSILFGQIIPNANLICSLVIIIDKNRLNTFKNTYNLKKQ